MTHNPVVLGAMEACALLPWLLFGLLGGALVDRWDRRRIMWLADLFRFALLAGVTGLVMAGAADVYLLFAVAFLLGIGQIFFDTASLAYLPELLEREPAALQRANARLQGTQQALEGFVGPPTGSFLFTLGRGVPIIADAVSFLASSLTISTLPKTPPKPARRAARCSRTPGRARPSCSATSSCSGCRCARPSATSRSWARTP